MASLTMEGFGLPGEKPIQEGHPIKTIMLDLAGTTNISCFFDDPTDVGNLISGSSAFSKSTLNTWKFTAHVLLKPGLENFEYYFASI